VLQVPTEEDMAVQQEVGVGTVEEVGRTGEEGMVSHVKMSHCMTPVRLSRT